MVKKPRTTPRTTPIDVTIGFDGSYFTYTDGAGHAVNKLKAHTGDTLRWTCDRPAAILFDPINPFGHMHYNNLGSADTVLRDESGNPPGTVVNGPGRFKYYVAILHEGKIHIDDPEVIIEY